MSFRVELMRAALGALVLAGCGGEAVIDAVADPCNQASCPDGYCNDAGDCVTRAAVCERACDYIPGCMTSTPTECYDFCFNDLGDCSDEQMRDTDLCTNTLIPDCDADGWLDCVVQISCLETE